MSSTSQNLGKVVPESITLGKDSEEDKEVIRHPEFVWRDNPFGFEEYQFCRVWITIAHVFGIWYLYLLWTGDVTLNTLYIGFLFGNLGGLGITVGCHRYWTHKTFKAKFPLQILLMIMQTIAAQYTIHHWCLNHRLHHKYTDTDADPHNSKRGLFFSHIGWLYLPRHPELQKKRNAFDMPDLENDPVVRFQSRYYWTLLFIFHTALPVAAYQYFYGLPLSYALAANYGRYMLCLNSTWMVNSVAHKWGDKPYDKSLSSSENIFVSLFAIGEGWHNYHHTFPWDYKTSELGWKVNISTMFIDFFAMIGWAYELKTVSKKMLKERLQRTADGFHVLDEAHESHGNGFDLSNSTNVSDMADMDQPLWGWGDERMTEDLRKMTKILNTKNNDYNLE